MTLPFILLLLVGAIAILLGFFLWKARYTRMVRLDAVLRSQAVTAGKVYEQLVPLLPGFQFNPKDARFLGSPVDFVVFDGLCTGDVKRVVFVDSLPETVGGKVLKYRLRDEHAELYDMEQAQ